MSTSRVLNPLLARPSARFKEVVVFPSPPFWFVIAMISIFYWQPLFFSIENKAVETSIFNLKIVKKEQILSFWS